MYTDNISEELAKKLIDFGMPVRKIIHPERAITYARVIDWLHHEHGIGFKLADLGIVDDSEKFTLYADSTRGNGIVYKLEGNFNDIMETAINEIIDSLT